MGHPEATRTASLVVAAALRGDETAVHLLLRSLDGEEQAIAAEAAVVGMSGLIRQFVPPDAIAGGVRVAQHLAQQAATEGN